MRESAEALDHLAMTMRVIEHVRQLWRLAHELGEKPDRLVLHRQPLGVLEGQVDERAHERRQRLVLARADHPARRGEGACIACKRPRAAAKSIAGELVEQEDLRQRRARLVAPGLELAAQRPLDERAEVLANGGVESRVLHEPGLARAAEFAAAGRAEPEVQHGAGFARPRLAHRGSADKRRGWISTERLPSATQTMPSCRLTWSCMLRWASKASSRLCSEGTSHASTLPARATRADKPAHHAGAPWLKA